MKRRALVATALLLTAPLALSGCSLAEAINPPVTAAIYATVPDAAGAATAVALPAWVPGDAAMIRIKTELVHNTSIMTFTVPQPAVPEGSEPDTPAPPVAAIGAECPADIAANRPTLDDSWWVSTIADDAVITCSDGWHIMINGLRIYAWTP